MEISGIQAGGGLQAGALGAGGAKAAADGGFADVFNALMDGLAASQGQADGAIQSLALGGDVNIADVVLATELEALAFQFALQVRNRFVETVQTVMNMQV